MWISFESDQKFAVKVYVGGVNAVSGEPSTDTEQTLVRRYKLLSERKSIQDYVVTPDQVWFDGIATQDGTVRQFVAMPLGSGYTVEAQITGADLIGGLQIEVTPSTRVPPVKIEPKPAGTPHFQIFVKTLTGSNVTLDVSELHTVAEVKLLVEGREGIPPDQQRLIYAGVALEDGRNITFYKIMRDSTVHLVLRLCGGGAVEPQMGIAAGGLIEQSIIRDDNDPAIWEPENGTIFNVQILNSAVFQTVTGRKPPKTPISARTYASYGFPYYAIYDEKPSGVTGDFSGVKSVAEKDIEGAPTLEKAKAIAEVIEDTHNPVVLLEKTSKPTAFRPVKFMEQELIKKFGKLEFN
jgi:hypothetical protein